MQSAILIVGPEIREEEGGDGLPQPSQATRHEQQGTPLVCAEILGLSVVARLIEELRHAGMGSVSVLGNVSGVSLNSDSTTRIEVCSAEEAWRGATQQLLVDKANGTDAVLVMRVGAYVDMDLVEVFQVHGEQKQAVTRAFDQKGPLDLWIIDPAEVSGSIDILTALYRSESAQFWVRGYTNRLQHPRDLRRLVVDALTTSNRFRPLGTESRPGIWIDDSAQVHRDARIVAPAFIGRGARIGEQCLITRSSNIESGCQIDYGTVVEDSSILSNSYVGIGLDLSHSIVDGSNLLDLERGVTLEIADPCVIRQNRTSRQEKNFKLPVTFGLGGVHASPFEDGSR